jgi:hypothetical protein
MHVTECQCSEPGWCDRHQCHKTDWMLEMCRRHQATFDLWERHQGPGQLTTLSRLAANPCVHIREVVRVVDCLGCSGNVLVKVYACELHGECTIGKQANNAACCAMCTDYRPGEVNKQMRQL